MKRKKQIIQIIKYLFVLFVLAMIVVVFRDSIGPTTEQIKKTRWQVIILIGMLGCLNFVFEGLNLTSLAKYYNPDFNRRDGIACAFYAAFYRTVTVGSGAFVAAAYYLNKKKVPVGCSLGLIAVQYVNYKLSIAVCSGIGMLLMYDYIQSLFGEYMGYIWIGYGIAVLIALALTLGCCMKSLHHLAIVILKKMDRKRRFAERIAQIEYQFEMLEKGTVGFFQNKILLFKLFARSMVRVIVWLLIPGIILGAVNLTEQVQAFSISAISNALAAVIPTPAGIGSTEFMFTVLFSRHCGDVLALSTMLLYRFSTFIAPFLAGSIVVLAEQRYHIVRKHKMTKSLSNETDYNYMEEETNETVRS